MNISQCLKYGEDNLSQNFDNWKRETEDFIGECINKDRLFILLNRDRVLDGNEEKMFLNYVARRKENEPFQYILGYTEFMGLRFNLSTSVLIPRQDTENLVELVLEHVKNTKWNKTIKILDLCTGSGAIGISLAHYLREYTDDFSVTISDISTQALEVAKENVRINNLEEKIQILESDLFKGFDENVKFDIIVSNPPYIAPYELENLDSQVIDFEPKLALYGGEDGLDFYRRISRDSKKYLHEKSFVFFEIGYAQGRDVCDIMKDDGYEDVELRQDYSKRDRIVLGSLQG